MSEESQTRKVRSMGSSRNEAGMKVLSSVECQLFDKLFSL